MDYFVGFKVSSNTTNEKFVLKDKQLMDNDDNFAKINLTKEDIDIINQKIQSGPGNPPGPGPIIAPDPVVPPGNPPVVPPHPNPPLGPGGPISDRWTIPIKDQD